MLIFLFKKKHINNYAKIEIGLNSFFITLLQNLMQANEYVYIRLNRMSTLLQF